MRTFVTGLALAVAALAVAGRAVVAQGTSVPYWAYGYLSAPKPGEAAPDCGVPLPVSCARPRAAAALDETPHSLPGAPKQYSRKQATEWFAPADWYPMDHPAMPPIVANGNEKTGVRACGLCHNPNGKGRPENAQVAGLPMNYFIQQMAAFKAGDRKSADPWKLNSKEMARMAATMTDAEIREAAQYFSSMKWTPFMKVVETANPPAYTETIGGLFMPKEGEGHGTTMPLGNRIIEVPEDPHGTEAYRNPRAGFIAYVPPGSIAKGEALATTGGNGKTLACNICHGPDLMGLGDVPGIAGRSASYLVRQMHDMQQGTRKTALMKSVVANLTEDDYIALGAYLASRPVK